MPIEDIDEHLYKDYVLHLKSALDNDVSINSTVAVAVAIEEALSKRFLVVNLQSRHHILCVSGLLFLFYTSYKIS